MASLPTGDQCLALGPTGDRRGTPGPNGDRCVTPGPIGDRWMGDGWIDWRVGTDYFNLVFGKLLKVLAS